MFYSEVEIETLKKDSFFNRKEGEKRLKPLREKLPSDIRVEVSTLQSDAGSLGAAML